MMIFFSPAWFTVSRLSVSCLRYSQSTPHSAASCLPALAVQFHSSLWTLVRANFHRLMIAPLWFCGSNVVVNLSFRTNEAVLLGIEGHVCELQLTLDSFDMITVLLVPHCFKFTAYPHCCKLTAYLVSHNPKFYSLMASFQNRYPQSENVLA
jgi:hypothetical protein